MQPTDRQTELVQRQPILSARQVAITVIFGAIGAAFELLQISIPGYLPGISFNFGGIWLSLSTMIAGPIAGIIVAFVISITGQVGIIGWPGYSIHVLVLAALYPMVYRIENPTRRLIGYLLVTMLALFLQYWWWIGLYSFVLQIIPFQAQLVLQFGYAYWVYLAIYFLVPALVLARAPQFVAPEWRWPWQKEQTESQVGQAGD
jgi:riboflavin transporter FmnP